MVLGLYTYYYSEAGRNAPLVTARGLIRHRGNLDHFHKLRIFAALETFGPPPLCLATIVVLGMREHWRR